MKNKLGKYFKISWSFVGILALVALFLTVFENYRFFHEVLSVYPYTSGDRLFLVSLTLALFLCQLLVLTLLTFFLPLRIAIVICLLLASFIGYFTDQLGIIVDSAMITNVIQTDAQEAFDLLSYSLLFRVLLLGMLPSILLFRIKLPEITYYQRSYSLFSTSIVSLISLVVVAMLFSNQYADFIRNNKSLRMYINPLTTLVSFIDLTNEKLSQHANSSLREIIEDAKIARADMDKELVIMVVGETARADRFSLNGYAKDTNPRLALEPNVASFTQISSCGTSTAISVPCMFSQLGRKDFDIKSNWKQENVLDVLRRLGVSVLWRDNNSSSKGVADRVEYQNFRDPSINPDCDSECRDIGMLGGLQEYIDNQEGDILIVLHQMGNHGPAYFKRYPPEFEKFKPVCHSSNLSECSQEEISNAYDNAILYTDYFLSQVIALLKRNSGNYETAMLYVSDHGESLGEHGLYLHGAPYFMAPEEQTHVPVILWMGGSENIDTEKTISSKDNINSQDAVFGSLLSLFEIESEQLAQDKNSLVKFHS